MQIVINISEEDYQLMKEGHIPFNVLDVIMNGTPLPKGHGKLIDVSEYFKKEFGDAREFLDKATPIIEAESED